MAIRQQREISILKNMKETIDNNYGDDIELDVDENEEIVNEHSNSKIQIASKGFQPGLSQLQSF